MKGKTTQENVKRERMRDKIQQEQITNARIEYQHPYIMEQSHSFTFLKGYISFELSIGHLIQ